MPRRPSTAKAFPAQSSRRPVRQVCELCSRLHILLFVSFTVRSILAHNQRLIPIILVGEAPYIKCFGNVSVEPEAAAVGADSVMWVASCTKLLTTVSAMQCVEKELFTLDEDVSRILPEWKEPDIVTGFDEKSGEPLLKKSTKPITLRHLLTHSSGLGYEGMNPLLMGIRKHQGRELQTTPGDMVSTYIIPSELFGFVWWETGLSRRKTVTKILELTEM